MLVVFAFYWLINHFLNFNLVCCLGNFGQDSPDEIGFWWTEVALPVTRLKVQKLQTKWFHSLVTTHPDGMIWIMQCSLHLLACFERNFNHHSVLLFLQSLHWGISLLCSLPLRRYLVICYWVILLLISYFYCYESHLSPSTISVYLSTAKSTSSTLRSPDS